MYEIKTERNPTSTLFRLPWHERWSYSGKLCTIFWRFRFGSLHVLGVGEHTITCACGRKKTRNSTFKIWHHRMTLDISIEFAASNRGSQTVSNDLLTKYFIKISNILNLIIMARGTDDKQRTYSHGTTAGGSSSAADACSLVPNCNGYTRLRVKHFGRMNQRKINSKKGDKKKETIFLAKRHWETLRAWPVSHSHDNLTGFCRATQMALGDGTRQKLCAVDCCHTTTTY